MCESRNSPAVLTVKINKINGCSENCIHLSGQIWIESHRPDSRLSYIADLSELGKGGVLILLHEVLQLLPRQVGTVHRQQCLVRWNNCYWLSCIPVLHLYPRPRCIIHPILHGHAPACCVFCTLLKISKSNPYLIILDFSQLFFADDPMAYEERKIIKNLLYHLSEDFRDLSVNRCWRIGFR